MTRIDYYHVENAPKPNSIVPAASAIVIDDQGRVLLHRRRDNDYWSLVGGRMEPGETIAATAVRETLEESGLDVIVKKLIGVYTDPKHIIAYSDGEIRQQFSVCFECSICGGELRCSDESKEVAFFTIEQLHTLKLHPAQWERIQDYLQHRDAAFFY
ncbi:MAG: NUDIX hydrolase [Armatimonadota bacterium]